MSFPRADLIINIVEVTSSLSGILLKLKKSLFKLFSYKKPFKYYVISGIGYIERGHKENNTAIIDEGINKLNEGKEFCISNDKSNIEIIYYGLALGYLYLNEPHAAESFIELINGDLQNCRDIQTLKTYLAKRT